MEECANYPQINADLETSDQSASEDNMVKARKSYKRFDLPPPRTPVPQFAREKSVSPRSAKENKENTKGPYNWTRLLLIVLIIIITLVPALMKHFTSAVDPEEECNKSLRRLRTDHPEQDSFVFASIQSATKSLFKRSGLHSLVLLYSDRDSSEKFVLDVLDSSVDCSVTGKRIPIVLQRQNFTPAMALDHGNVLTTFGDQLKEETTGGIMLVSDVNLLPVGVVQAFHALCDRYNPWAAPAIIFFTINVGKGNDERAQENADELATSILKSDWAELPANVLDPLITRITDQVLYVR